jgi:hypothetical protein
MQVVIDFHGSKEFQHKSVAKAFRSVGPYQGWGTTGHAKLKQHGWITSVDLVAVPNKVAGGDDSDEKHDLVNRQDQDWVTGFMIRDSPPEKFWQQVQGSLSGGSGTNKWTIRESDTKTYGLETSVEIGANLFNVSSASGSVFFSYEDQVTSSVDTKIIYDCCSSQTGTLYWAPKYTQYHESYRSRELSSIFLR